MGTVNVAINGQTYTLACRDGEEGRLKELSELVDAKAHELSRRVGQVGETRLMVMVSLMIADALHETRQGINPQQNIDSVEIGDANRVLADAEARVTALADRLEHGSSPT